ncbi:Methylesterase 17 [Hibiscus syriacus]|uniref:Methylesterase 17 n=1 Tax=Hibiscus syriacus TaxID=106335 RepID=A0A6A3B2D4_HIBSY|nr:Methylesterase 17 [Hibiscus syriacus]
MSMAEKGTPADMKRTHFVLVHGIGGGAWCWYKIRGLVENCNTPNPYPTRIRNCGYKVSCIDLKGAGIDRADTSTILSFDDYNQPLVDFMSALPDTEKVILVGHSAGGLSVTQATHRLPNKIRLAVYVAATMLKSGFFTDQDVKDGVPDLSQFGDVYELGFGLGAEQPPTSAIVKKEFQCKIIYQMSPLVDSTLAEMVLRLGPVLAPRSARFEEEDGESVEKVGRVYIRTMHDNVVIPEQQEAMIKKWPPCQVYALANSFFSAPFSLFGLLLKFAATSGGCN